MVLSETASSVPLVVRGATSATANLTEWQNSSGTVLAGISANGDFFIPGKGLKITRNTEPEDHELQIGEVVIYFDCRDFGSKLCIKGKTATGNIVKNEINLY